MSMLKRIGPARQRKRAGSKGPPFLQIFRYAFNSPAYVSLSSAARSALLEVIGAYNGLNNGEIVMSVRYLAERMAAPSPPPIGRFTNSPKRGLSSQPSKEPSASNTDAPPDGGSMTGAAM
jgi:hypothetical protein